MQGRIQTPITLNPTLADIETLNTLAMKKKFPLIKVSAFCLGNITQHYRLLPVGAAIGFHSGPKLVAETSFPLHDMASKVIASPGKDTTAHLLFQLFFPKPKQIVYLPYHEIIPAIQKRTVDAGIIIHESRFTFEKQGLQELVDLGDYYTQQTGLPLPLGVIAVERSLNMLEISRTLKASIDYARENPETVAPYIQMHAQEKDPVIIAKHIDLFVTQETEEISPQGIESIRSLFELAIQKKLLPKTALDFV